MSRLKALLHVARARECNTQQTSVQACKAVAQHTHTTQQADTRRQRVLAMLEKSPGIKYALITDTDSDPVLLTLAIRGKATCEFQIPRDRYDGFLLLDLIERHGETVH